jgi:hypothetical protein
MKDILIQISFLSSHSVLQFSCFRNFHFRHFGISGLRVSGFRGFVPRGFQTCFPFQPPTSEIPTYFTLRAHIAQWSPTTTVASGTFMRVHITFNDVIRSHLSRFSSQPTGTWYISMCPRQFLEKSNGQVLLPQSMV